ncbi:hypothetical protein [Mesorhizobium sp.]|uniref:hypothetical protein n=1 Tax=Mesorhizobium sp. TaxID=1871066 RepID=UPI00257F6DA8|nr:hypothetical protein [Mesorhizobium sp.]
MGLPGNKVLQNLVDEAADDIRTRCKALEQKPVPRGYAENPIQGEIWKTQHHVVCARVEASSTDLDGPLRCHKPRQKLRRTSLQRDRLRATGANVREIVRRHGANQGLLAGCLQRSPPQSGLLFDRPLAPTPASNHPYL